MPGHDRDIRIGEGDSLTASPSHTTVDEVGSEAGTYFRQQADSQELMATLIKAGPVGSAIIAKSEARYYLPNSHLGSWPYCAVPTDRLVDFTPAGAIDLTEQFANDILQNIRPNFAKKSE